MIVKGTVARRAETILEELKLYGWVGRYADWIEKALRNFLLPQDSVSLATSELFFSLMLASFPTVTNRQLNKSFNFIS